jgi:hypothetical protein
MKQDRTSKFSKKAKKNANNIKKQNETHQQQEKKMSTLISVTSSKMRKSFNRPHSSFLARDLASRNFRE